MCVCCQAVEKIREFLLQKIYQFRKPMTNYQVSQNTLLKFRFSLSTIIFSARQHMCYSLPSATGRFRQQQLEPGTVCLPRLKPPTHCCSSGERQKRTFSTSRFWTNLRTIADSRTSQCSQRACLNYMYVQCPCNVSM